jgi:hypothetical protein
MTWEDDFFTLFRGRGDCYGSWEGGCIKQPLTRERYKYHLTNGPHIGVYPCVTINGIAQCVWSCSDIDYPDPADAQSLCAALQAFGLTPWLEQTRKGWHVWVFATGLTPASDMRDMFLLAHQIIEVPPKEVNPKQTTLTVGQVGNYVRLPYPAGFDATDRRAVADTGGPLDVFLTPEDFVTQAIATRATPAEIAEVASYYTPPPAPVLDNMREASGDVMVAASMLTPLGKTIYRNGPAEWRDRSTAVTHLAHECFKAGLSPQDALLVLQEADSRWGKFMQRGAAGEAEILKLVQRAYGSIPST